MDILLVATTTVVGSLTAAEASERNALLTIGHNVTLRAVADAVPASWAGISLVMPTSSATSGSFHPKYDAVPVGVASFDAAQYPHTHISSQSFASAGTVVTTLWFTTDTITGTLGNGQRTVYSSAPALAYTYVDSATQLPASAQKWTKKDTASTRVVGFGFEVGAVMANASLNAGGRKAVIGIRTLANIASQDIWDYIERVLAWTANVAAGTSVSVTGSKASGSAASPGGTVSAARVKTVAGTLAVVSALALTGSVSAERDASFAGDPASSAATGHDGSVSATRNAQVDGSSATAQASALSGFAGVAPRITLPRLTLTVPTPNLTLTAANTTLTLTVPTSTLELT